MDSCYEDKVIKDNYVEMGRSPSKDGKEMEIGPRTSSINSQVYKDRFSAAMERTSPKGTEAKLYSKSKASRFSSWSRAQLIQILIHPPPPAPGMPSDGCELRNESIITHTTLRELAEEFFYGEPMPNKPLPRTARERRIILKMVLFVQRWWIDREYEKNLNLEAVAEYEARVSSASWEYEDENNETSMFDDPNNYDDVHAAVQVDEMAPNQNGYVNVSQTDIAQVSFGDPEEAVQQGFVREKSVIVKSKIIGYLDQEWTPPDWEKAKKHAEVVQPRRREKIKNELKYNTYDFRTITTGE